MEFALRESGGAASKEKKREALSSMAFTRLKREQKEFIIKKLESIVEIV